MASFDNQTIETVWQKGQAVAGNDPKVWRKDACGAWMKRGEYGNRNSQYGWEIDHIKPVVFGGANFVSNLRPLQWANNAAKHDGRLVCAVVASGEKNARVQARP